MGLKAFDSAKRTSGDITVSGSSWADLDTGLDLTLPAEVGDLIEVGLSGVWDSEARSGYIDVASLVSAAEVNYWGVDGSESASHQGVVAWRGEASQRDSIGGSISRKVVSGDLESGVLTLRWRTHLDAAGTKDLFAQTTVPLHVWAKNHGAT